MDDVSPTDRAGSGPDLDGTVTRPDGLRYLEPIRARAFLGLVRAGDGLSRALGATLQREHDLNLNEFEVLLFLAVFAPDGYLRMSELTAQAPLSQSRVSRLVAGLEARGLVRRTEASGDGRGVEAHITDAGIAVFSSARETHLADLDDLLFSKLDADEVSALASITAKLLAPDD